MADILSQLFVDAGSVIKKSLKGANDALAETSFGKSIAENSPVFVDAEGDTQVNEENTQKLYDNVSGFGVGSLSKAASKVGKFMQLDGEIGFPAKGIVERRPLSSVKPSQSGADLFNEMSEGYARGDIVENLYKSNERPINVGALKDPETLPPIVVDRFGRIIDGNHRWAAAKMQGLKDIDVIVHNEPVQRGFIKDDILKGLGVGTAVTTPLFIPSVTTYEKKPIGLVKTDRGNVKVGDSRILEAIVFGEATTSPQQMEQIINVAVNRAVKSGQSLDAVLTAPNQFQAYAGNQYKKYMSGALDTASKAKAALVKQTVQKFLSGQLKDTVAGSQFYVHDKNGKLHYSDDFNELKKFL